MKLHWAKKNTADDRSLHLNREIAALLARVWVRPYWLTNGEPDRGTRYRRSHEGMPGVVNESHWQENTDFYHNLVYGAVGTGGFVGYASKNLRITSQELDHAVPCRPVLSPRCVTIISVQDGWIKQIFKCSGLLMSHKFELFRGSILEICGMLYRCLKSYKKSRRTKVHLEMAVKYDLHHNSYKVEQIDYVQNK